MITEKNIIDERTYNRRSFGKVVPWTAIFAGAFVGLGISFLLYVFGLSIGLSSFTATPAGVNTLAIGGFVGSAIGAIVSMFVGGWIAGYLARRSYGFRGYDSTSAKDHDFKNCGNIGALYGFITWSLMLVVTIVLATHVTAYVASRYNTVSNPTAPIISTSTYTGTPTVSEHRMTTTDPNKMTVQDEKAVNTVGKTLFGLFVLFFIGAFSSCLGGYMGIKFRCHHDVDDKDVHTTNTKNL